MTVPQVSVVMATHDRPERLARQLAALRAQTLPDGAYEIVVIDDGSGAETRELLEGEQHRPGPAVRLLRQEPAAGPTRARNAGWRAARAGLIAFTDDDCEATPRWLESLLEAWDGEPRRFVQGRTVPNPDEAHLLGPLSHSLWTEALGPWWETANILYPRAALEHVGGLDEAFGHAGEDTDLGWRVIEAGYEPAWAPAAVVHHAVTRVGHVGKLRIAWRWDEAMLNFKRHPALRRHLTAGLFWIPTHWWLARALAALLVPRRLLWVRWWLAAPYVVRLGKPRPDVAAFLVMHDLVEIAACVRGSLRHRVFVL